MTSQACLTDVDDEDEFDDDDETAVLLRWDMQPMKGTKLVRLPP